ncbi:hypothetical protein CKAH01_12342 [Colletotrichum kahawae]|uniref:Uncharacterized protein n=1 Tax=Colletotrichum kahawae TaxID=34407 RepID=A0AAD9YTM5_COLKA|nr:hypothetical protein CKAH01_12342 [Colletotrichum kahawae]
MDTTGLSVASSMEGISGVTKAFALRSHESAASKRLFWTLNGPLETAIQVAPNQYYEPGNVMEPYFRPAAAGLAPSWHPVSQESLMEPQVATITVRLECFDAWEDLWVELHRHCTDTRTDPRRPRAKDVQLKVTASGGDGTFVTIHDYVSAVHPWIMDMREPLLDVLYKVGGGQLFLPEMKLAVLQFGVGPLSIGREDQWASFHKKPKPPGTYRPVSSISPEENEEITRKVTERMKARSAARILEMERLRQENARGDGPVHLTFNIGHATFPLPDPFKYCVQKPESDTPDR